jgi:hypothetical protein
MHKTKTTEIIIIMHTTCGLEFEIIDSATGQSLTPGRMTWCSDDDLDMDETLESKGWDWARKYAAKCGWKVTGEVLS